ncbi:AraC family transcriptional regulator [Spongiimicrobium salis]|uniref:AraC family transcriptional regulator n=1 Tax=Spongiimicrobium salis TaxID=1667022 RepID=UPI00374D68CE
MKIQLETIGANDNKSFGMMFNPRMSDLFFWHFHPEYELVYIDGANGTRHVGDHISNYEGNDLVLIGSNIPHLNFDYGIKGSYRKVVVHIKKDFVEGHIQGIPEFDKVAQLFKKSAHGIAFKGPIKEQIGNALFHLEQEPPFQQYLQLLELFRLLSASSETVLLHDQPYTISHNDKAQERLQRIYAFVDNNYDRKIDLSEVAAISNMTKEAFCRYFKQTTRYTFVAFLNRYRISQSKRHLMSGKSVSEACYRCGFDSLSYYNRVFKKVTSENPRDFRKRYL